MINEISVVLPSLDEEESLPNLVDEIISEFEEKAITYEIIIVDDREEYANSERFPMAKQIHSDKIANSLNKITIDHLSYVVLVSRGHKLDEEALEFVVETNASYVGMIGSKRRTKIVLDNLLSRGISAENLNKVFYYATFSYLPSFFKSMMGSSMTGSSITGE